VLASTFDSTPSSAPVYFFAVWACAVAAWNKAIFPKSRLVMEVVSGFALP
jgi:hypothetical protein